MAQRNSEKNQKFLVLSDKWFVLHVDFLFQSRYYD